MHKLNHTFALLTATGFVAMCLQAQTPADFVAITPCRIVDTRGAPGTFGGPSLSAGSVRNFPIPFGPCGIPSTAAAYSLNVTVVPSGPTLSYLVVWAQGLAMPPTSTVNSPNGAVIANGTIVAAGTNGGVSVSASDPTDVILDINGYFTVQVSVGVGNTSLGTGALSSNTAGFSNTAVGYHALNANTTGNNNNALGLFALNSETTGSNNVALGSNALLSDTTGSNNVAVGIAPLEGNQTGNNNTALGNGALANNVLGNYNTMIGSGAAGSLTGSNNVGVGYQAGSGLTTGNYNIDIGNQGTFADSGVIRIGDPNQSSTYIAGIAGATVSGSAVLIDTVTGQLGIASSSLRYKEDVRDMGEASDALMELRPVTFHYKQPAAGGTKPLQYGLIGEEVANIYPELVSRGPQGEIESVQYHALPALLLNEAQKQHRLIQAQSEEIKSLDARIAVLEHLLSQAGVTSGFAGTHSALR